MLWRPVACDVRALKVDLVGKALKFPELQSKFERAVATILVERSPLSGAELLKASDQRAEAFSLTAPELADLVVNSANYFTRAKQNGVLISNGKSRGYALAPNAVAAVASRRDDSSAEDGEASESRVDLSDLLPLPAGGSPVEGVRNQQWESLLHLPASLVLARRFGARVLSLAKITDRGAKWGNPDILMVRSSPLETLEPFLREREIDVSKFRLVDETPQAILSSIELKFGLAGNRSLWFQAVAETAANSLWANEAWLVFMELESVPGSLDRELLALARSAEIGILELVLRHDDGVYFDVVEHRAAVIRPRLRVADMDPEQRIGLLGSAHRLLADFVEAGTFLDADGNANKARVLLMQALCNLRSQTGFGGRPLSEALAPMGRNQSFLGALAVASLDHVAELLTTQADLAWVEIQNSIQNSVVAIQADRAQRDIADLRAAASLEAVPS